MSLSSFGVLNYLSHGSSNEFGGIGNFLMLFYGFLIILKPAQIYLKVTIITFLITNLAGVKVYNHISSSLGD